MTKERLLAALKVATIATTLCIAVITLGVILSNIIVYILQYIGITNMGTLFCITISLVTAILIFVVLFITELLAND